jgi:hypothetical protein
MLIGANRRSTQPIDKVRFLMETKRRGQPVGAMPCSFILTAGPFGRVGEPKCPCWRYAPSVLVVLPVPSGVCGLGPVFRDFGPIRGLAMASD